MLVGFKVEFERIRNAKERKDRKTSRQNRFETIAKQENLKTRQKHRRLCINAEARQKETQEIV